MAQMKTRPNDAAFARPFSQAPDQRFAPSPGLTKREHFAGLALQGLLACSSTGGRNAEWHAEKALACADALIEALNGEADS